jgi:hypothetical protein
MLGLTEPTRTHWEIHAFKGDFRGSENRFSAIQADPYHQNFFNTVRIRDPQVGLFPLWKLVQLPLATARQSGSGSKHEHP